MPKDNTIDPINEDIDPAGKTIRHFAPVLILKGLVCLLAGTVLLFWPGTGLKIVSVILGLFLIVDGINRLITVLLNPGTTEKSDVLSIAGVLLRIVLGAILLFLPRETSNFWISLVFIITGINLIGNSLFLFWNRSRIQKDFLSLMYAVLMLGLGLLMILLPMFTVSLLFRGLGGVLVLVAVPSLAVGLRSRR